MTPSRVSITNVEYVASQKRMYVNRMYEYEVDTEVSKKATKIMQEWLNLARLSLRVLGGSVSCPLVTQEAVSAIEARLKDRKWGGRSFYPPSSSHVLNYKIGGEHDTIQNIITEKKVDHNSLATVFNIAKYGEQKWENVRRKVMAEYKPLVILALIRQEVDGKLEDS